MSEQGKNNPIMLYICGEHPAAQYAASELARYLGLITGQPVDTRRVNPRFGSWALWVNTQPGQLLMLPEVANPDLDDAIVVQMEAGSGVLIGNNPRSLLLAVYRFLREIGCSWVRPGKLGERVPQKKVQSLSACLIEKAALRHRGICIEGAVSCENLLDIIDWAPKVGFNSYFIQFREAFTFFDRWYSHWLNPHLKPEPFGIEQAQEMAHQAEHEIKKRGMLYHAVGHGWTCEPLGISGLGWVPKTFELDDKTRSYLAEVNGKREIWQGIPLNTNLCYSNPEVKQLLVRSIIDYLLEHPEIDYLHFWLADDRNNQCECPACQQATPSDFYVEILNALDQQMTGMDLHTHIVFLIYFDLLWTPAVVQIHNPERFTLMFAPITRTYSCSFTPSSAFPPVPAYVRNQLVFPASIEENLAFLKNWQAIFSGDSFVFDYHFWRDHYNDPGYYAIAEILYKDIHNLKAIGLNGFMSCQVQRAFFPTGFGMTVMGRALWDERLEFEDISCEYFAQAFGPGGEQVQEYLAQLSMLFDPCYFRGEQPRNNLQVAQRFARIPLVIDNFRPVIEQNLLLEDPCWARSWKYLRMHTDAVEQFAHIAEMLARDERAAARTYWENLQDWAARHEEELQPVFDLYEFITVINMNLFEIDEIG
jgi:hypothetical protein